MVHLVGVPSLTSLGAPHRRALHVGRAVRAGAAELDDGRRERRDPLCGGERQTQGGGGWFGGRASRGWVTARRVGV